MDPSEKKKLVISADDLAAGEETDAAEDATRVLPAEDATKALPSEEVTLKAKKPAPTPPPPTRAKTSGPKGATAPAPPRKPPAASAAASPAQGPWHRRHPRVLLFGGGLAAALAVGFLVAFVLLGIFDSDDDTAREALTTSTASFEDTTADARRSARAPLPFTELSEVADSSADRAAAIGETAADLAEKVDEEGLVRPSVKALKAEQKFLARFSRIASFPESELGKRWRSLKPQLEQSQQRIDASRRAVLALDLGDTANLMPANSSITAAVDSADRIIIAANRKVQAWRDQREAAENQLASAESYKSEMSSLMDQYYEQRNDTQDLVRESNVHWKTAEETLLSHASARQGIIESMSALAVPLQSQSSHEQMVSLATQSKGLLETAAEDAASPLEPIIWTGSPGWSRLSSSSEEITQQFGPAESSVLASADQAIAAEEAKLRQVGPRPQL